MEHLRLGNERRDRKEKIMLCDTYISAQRCRGGHLVHGNYCCHLCGSDDPSNECWKEKVIHDNGVVRPMTSCEKRDLVARGE